MLLEVKVEAQTTVLDVYGKSGLGFWFLCIDILKVPGCAIKEYFFLPLLSSFVKVTRPGRLVTYYITDNKTYYQSYYLQSTFLLSHNLFTYLFNI